MVAVITFDSHKFYMHLKASGMPDSWADAITVGLSEAQRSMPVASKKDLSQNLSQELLLPVKQQLKSLETNVVNKIAYFALFLIVLFTVFLLLRAR